MLAAASIVGADAVLRVGGAQAIAALAFGVRDDALAPGAVGSIAAAGPLVEPVDVIVGPGNAYVTAAKQLVSGAVAIDMLAGPSELVVIADASADAETVAADLLAQSEHDVMASAVLIATDADLVERVNDALERQLDALPTRDTARASIEANGMAVVADDLDDAATLSDRLAPEHLEILASPDVAERVAARIRHAGAVFIGDGAAEVFGDYGLGPNHTLPTGGTARSFAGLSVHTFLRTRTFIRAAGELDPVAVRDTVTLARVEGLEGHARSGERRM
jgi:phosphoribosyl-ATP pyrophosphohydrolase/phosphoribosyl-AMP cyclohydrolase/histidinol dehydrogenase